MRARSLLTEAQREQLVALFEEGYGYVAAAHRLGVGRGATRRLFSRFQLHGRLCLVDKPTKHTYSFEVKKEIIERHLAGATRMELAKEFDLSSPTLVKDWMRRYRKEGWDGLKPKPKGRPTGSAKPKPLTEEDKLRRENERLKAENAYLKKLRDLRNQGLA